MSERFWDGCANIVIYNSWAIFSFIACGLLAYALYYTNTFPNENKTQESSASNPGYTEIAPEISEPVIILGMTVDQVHQYIVSQTELTISPPTEAVIALKNNIPDFDLPPFTYINETNKNVWVPVPSNHLAIIITTAGKDHAYIVHPGEQSTLEDPLKVSVGYDQAVIFISFFKFDLISDEFRRQQNTSEMGWGLDHP